MVVQQQCDMCAAIAYGVVQQIGDDFAQQDGRALQKEFLMRIDMVLNRQCLARSLGMAAPARRRLQHGLHGIEALGLGGRILGHARIGQQLLDHARAAGGDLIELGQHFGVHGLLRVGLLYAPHVADQQAYAGHGCLQLVGGIGDKTALFGDRGLQPLQQGVGVGH